MPRLEGDSGRLPRTCEHSAGACGCSPPPLPSPLPARRPYVNATPFPTAVEEYLTALNLDALAAEGLAPHEEQALAQLAAAAAAAAPPMLTGAQLYDALNQHTRVLGTVSGGARRHGDALCPGCVAMLACWRRRHDVQVKAAAHPLNLLAGLRQH